MKTDYGSYLRSAEWAARRSWKIAEADGRCQVCDSAIGLEVHHRTYERLGDERQSDLVVLCRQCHELFHGTSGGPSLREKQAAQSCIPAAEVRRRPWVAEVARLEADGRGDEAANAAQRALMARREELEIQPTPARAPTRGQIPAGAAHQPASVPTCLPASTATPAPGSIDRREET